MAIWSLTQERVQKLLNQIGDKEVEIDALIKLTPKDLWTRDLDDFVNEWNTQIDEDAKRAKKIANMGRRGSQKLGIGASKGKAKKKRKMDDSDTLGDSDSDFGPVKKKAAVSKAKPGGLLGYLRKEEPPKKPSATEAPKKQGGMLRYLTKKGPDPSTDGAMEIDEPVRPTVTAKEKKSQVATKAAKKLTPAPIDSDSDSDVFAAVAKETSKKPAETVTASRTARGAAKKVSRYTVDEDSDSDGFGDPFLDVSSMVKTIGGGSNDQPLFSTTTNRPGSGSASAGGATKMTGRLGIQKNSPVEVDDDETNYEGLMPPSSPQKPAPRNVNDTLLGSDDEDDFGFSKAKPAAKVAAKPKPVARQVKAPSKTAKAAPKPKATQPAVVAKKTTQLSPAAKAYAAKFAKGKDPKPTSNAKKPVMVDSDDEMEDADDLANDILSDDEDDDEPTPKPRAAPAGRPGRRAAAKPARYIESDDDSEEASEPEFDDDDSE
jgi:DNA topoisomerase-2